MIILEDVVKAVSGNRRMVNGVSLSIREKEKIRICGVPGSGKETLMRLIGGITPPSSGRVFVLGEALHEMNADEAAAFRNKNIGVILRNPGFAVRLNVFDNVALPLAVQGVPLPRRERMVKEQLKMLGILHIAHVFPAQISVCEALMASVARALIMKPKVLLLYEVKAGLTEREAEKVAGTFGALSNFGNYTIVSFGAETADEMSWGRTVILDHGKIQEDRS